jgi:hypothetical protein
VISDPWLDRSRERCPKTGREFRTGLDYRKRVAERRSLLESLGKCINGPVKGRVGLKGVVHGKPVKAGKCKRCLAVHR